MALKDFTPHFVFTDNPKILKKELSKQIQFPPVKVLPLLQSLSKSLDPFKSDNELHKFLEYDSPRLRFAQGKYSFISILIVI